MSSYKSKDVGVKKILCCNYEPVTSLLSDSAFSLNYSCSLFAFFRPAFMCFSFSCLKSKPSKQVRFLTAAFTSSVQPHDVFWVWAAGFFSFSISTMWLCSTISYQTVTLKSPGCLYLESSSADCTWYHHKAALPTCLSSSLWLSVSPCRLVKKLNVSLQRFSLAVRTV